MAGEAEVDPHALTMMLVRCTRWSPRGRGVQDLLGSLESRATLLLDGQRAFHTSLFVSRLAAEVGVRARFVDCEGGHSLLARLCGALYWLRDTFGNAEVVDELPGVVQLDLDRLTSFGAQRGRIELQGVHGFDGELLRRCRSRSCAVRWLVSRRA